MKPKQKRKTQISLWITVAANEALDLEKQKRKVPKLHLASDAILAAYPIK